MIYSDQATVESRFGKIKTQEDLETELENLPHHKGKTRIDLALKLANTEVFSRNGGMRSSSSVKKVAVVITDGRQSPAPDEIRLDEAAAPLLFLGVKVLSIGVGDKIDISELKMMVENPEKDAFWSESYPALRLQLATIAREICSHKIYAMWRWMDYSTREFLLGSWDGDVNGQLKLLKYVFRFGRNHISRASLENSDSLGRENALAYVMEWLDVQL